MAFVFAMYFIKIKINHIRKQLIRDILIDICSHNNNNAHYAKFEEQLSNFIAKRVALWRWNLFYTWFEVNVIDHSIK